MQNAIGHPSVSYHQIRQGLKRVWPSKEMAFFANMRGCGKLNSITSDNIVFALQNLTITAFLLKSQSLSTKKTLLSAGQKGLFLSDAFLSKRVCIFRCAPRGNGQFVFEYSADRGASVQHPKALGYAEKKVRSG